jgi:hypothetical protein
MGGSSEVLVQALRIKVTFFGNFAERIPFSRKDTGTRPGRNVKPYWKTFFEISIFKVQKKRQGFTTTVPCRAMILKHMFYFVNADRAHLEERDLLREVPGYSETLKEAPS